MIEFVLCSGISADSGRRLCDAITQRQEQRCWYINRNRILHPERRHVRYGKLRPSSANCLNSLEAVGNAADKLFALGVLGDAGVPTPANIVLDGHLETVPYRRIFRLAERHAGNDDPYIVEANAAADMARVATYDYGMQCVVVHTEYRVHVFRGDAFIYQVKLPRGGEAQHPDIRSSDRGWRLVTCANPYPDGELGTPAIAAVNALGLDFGAVDILRGVDGNFYVIEVNTAPGISARKAAKYAARIVAWDQQHHE